VHVFVSHVSIRRFQRTYKGASTGRKLFRLLKWLKEYQAAIDACSTKVLFVLVGYRGAGVLCFDGPGWPSQNELLRSLRILQHICLVRVVALCYCRPAAY